MFTQTWNKYLPIIHILMKRAATGDQLLDMNATDFERAGAGRKSGYKFSIRFRDGRLDTMVSSVPLARDLAATLLPDPRVKELIDQNDYEFSLSAKFQLSIRFIPRVPIAGEVAPVQQEAASIDTPAAE
jgi:hypothetical protein